jgi:hypothetical protein
MNRKLLTAQRLDDGAVVYFTGGGRWSNRLTDAHLSADDKQADEILADAASAGNEGLIVDAYVMDVALREGVIEPLRMREKIRAMGPTTPMGMACRPMVAAE